MEVKMFTEDPKVIFLLNTLNEHYKDGLEISDVIDDEGHQYVDLVQEGGGILGIALLGFTYVLEQMGIRFLNIGGTSAGAINSLLLAACDKPAEEKTIRLLHVLANKNLNDFIDGDEDAKDFIKTMMDKKLTKFKFFWKGAQVLDNLSNDLGLNPGDKFLEWLKSTLSDFHVDNTAELLAKMNNLPSSINFRASRKDLTDAKIEANLAIIAAELNTETKIEFPKMRALFYESPDRANPADFVRASMSVPIFFKPFEIENLPTGEEAILNWIRMANHFAGPPKKAIFVDGGVMSNFPIDVFHRKNGLPTRPTIGIKLGLERRTNKEIKRIKSLIYGCFEAARNLRDFEFINKNPDYKNLVAFINTEGFNWLDFNVSDKDKLKLFQEGVETACRFLKEFDWREYKKVRGSLIGNSKLILLLDERVKMLKEIKVHKGQNFDDNDIANLRARLENFGKIIDKNVLWIDDNPDEVEKEQVLLNHLGFNSTTVSTTDEAKLILSEKNQLIDFIITDVWHKENYTAGIEFTQWAAKTYPKYKGKVIFYISDFDPGKGKPAYNFGMTDSALELVHLVLDLIRRDTKDKM